MTKTSSQRSNVFISYSYEDQIWLERLQVHLKPLERQGKIDLWDDTRLLAGDTIDTDIRQAIASAKIAVLLISADYLASDDLFDNQLAALLTAAQDRQIQILPILVSDCLYQSSPLGQYPLFNADVGALKNLTPAELEQLFTNVARVLSGEEKQEITTSTPPDWQFDDLNSNRGWRVEAVQIERVPHYRQDVIERLTSEQWGQRYRRMLQALLAVAERIWGPRGSSQALITCVFFSLVYGYALFWFSVVSGWENPLAQAVRLDDISKLEPERRWILFGLLVLLPIVFWLWGRWIGYLEKHFKTTKRRRRPRALRKGWLRYYHVISGVMLLLSIVGMFFLIVNSTFGSTLRNIAIAWFFSLLFSAGPIVGARWGGRAQHPWRALLLSMIGIAVTLVAVATLTAILTLNFTLVVVVVVVVAIAVVVAAVAVTAVVVGALTLAGALAVAGILALVGALAEAVAVADGALTGIGVVSIAAALTLVVAGASAIMSMRPGMKLVNLFATMIGVFATLALIGIIFNPGNNSVVFFIISMLILPLMNGALDFFSWWVSRWLGNDLVKGFSGATSTLTMLNRSLLHVAFDLLLALFFFVAMAAALGFSFEVYDLYAKLESVVLLEQTETGPVGYIEDLREDPIGAGLWVTLMLFTTLIPTIIHFGMVLGAVFPALLLPDVKRAALATELAALPAEPPHESQAREHWKETIVQAAKFSASYRWRMVWGSLLTFLLVGGLLYALGTMSEHVFLTEWAYWGGVKGIEAARWLFAAG